MLSSKSSSFCHLLSESLLSVLDLSLPFALFSTSNSYGTGMCLHDRFFYCHVVRPVSSCYAAYCGIMTYRYNRSLPGAPGTFWTEELSLKRCWTCLSLYVDSIVFVHLLFCLVFVKATVVYGTDFAADREARHHSITGPEHDGRCSPKGFNNN